LSSSSGPRMSSRIDAARMQMSLVNWWSVQRATHVFPHRCGEDADVACELVELIQSDGHDLITLADGNGVLRRTKLQGVVSQRSRLHNSPVT
ncbi:hypothetical protein, partial [Pseudomonas aeruginosa]|uniref:hypothetical protein n=1 Tax=Pseudomonas aeruginosa TaxID=287 RepID=UPI001A9D094C